MYIRTDTCEFTITINGSHDEAAPRTPNSPVMVIKIPVTIKSTAPETKSGIKYATVVPSICKNIPTDSIDTPIA